MALFPRLALRVDSTGAVTRRRFLGGLTGGLAGLGWARPLPALADELRRQGRSCILLWMAGGPSQFETFDPKPGAATGAGPLVRDHRELYEQTARLVTSPRTSAFRLDLEPGAVRDLYGASPFGQGCLMARRLIEAGVPFVEVQSGGWDTHGNELPALKKLIPPVDRGTAALPAELKVRGLLERTLVIWMGEFGRTPRVNLTAGRDHYPQAFNLFLAGCGVTGGPG